MATILPPDVTYDPVHDVGTPLPSDPEYDAALQRGLDAMAEIAALSLRIAMLEAESGAALSGRAIFQRLALSDPLLPHAEHGHGCDRYIPDTPLDVWLQGIEALLEDEA